MHQTKMLVDRRIEGKLPDGHPCHMLLPINCFSHDRKVEIVQCSSLSDGAGYSLIKITDPTKELDKYCGPTHEVNLMGECSIIRTGNGQYLATILNVNCKLARVASDSGCFITSAIPLNDDIIEWIVIAPNKTLIKNLINRMRDGGYYVSSLYSAELEYSYSLTPRQEEVVRYAFENGYYEVPKRITTEDLCDMFKCSKSTMSVLIRDAEKNIIKYYLDLGKGRISKR